jgi:transposase-like protein
MTRKNKYAHRSRISEAKFRELVRLFAADLDAGQIAEIARLNRNTVNRYLRLIRQRIAEFCEAEFPFSAEGEVDESYFGPRRVRGKRGRGAFGKTTVFWLIKRQGKVYTQIGPDARKATLPAIIRGRVDPTSVIYSDGFGGYVGYDKHFRVKHEEKQFVEGKVHINGIEGFWGVAKTRLAKFRGLPKHTFYLHLKETEFRFNYRDHDLYRLILAILRDNPLS